MVLVTLNLLPIHNEYIISSELFLLLGSSNTSFCVIPSELTKFPCRTTYIQYSSILNSTFIFSSVEHVLVHSYSQLLSLLPCSSTQYISLFFVTFAIQVPSRITFTPCKSSYSIVSIKGCFEPFGKAK